MRMYLEGYHFVVTTNHQALKWLNSNKSPSGRIARWALAMQPYSFDIRYRKVKLNVVADVLSLILKEKVYGADVEEDD